MQAVRRCTCRVAAVWAIGARWFNCEDGIEEVSKVASSNGYLHGIVWHAVGPTIL